MRMIVDKATRQILGVWGDGREDTNRHDAAEVDLAGFVGLPDGEKYLEANGTMRSEPAPPTPDERQAATDRSTARDAIAQLLADAQALERATAPTAAQQRAMLARTDRALVAFARLLRRNGTI